MSTDSATIEGVPTGFLSLPGEIRNQIYKYLATPLNRVRLSRDSPDYGIHPIDRPIWDMHHKGLGLTQTNRILRHKFLPFMFEHTTYRIDCLDACDFIDAFYPKSKPKYWRLEIDFANSRGQRVDLLPIFRIHAEGVLKTRSIRVITPETVKKCPYKTTESLGLTQTCRFIRQEFHPLQLAGVKYAVQGPDIDDYIRTFHNERTCLPPQLILDFHGTLNETIELMPILSMLLAGAEMMLAPTSQLGHKEPPGNTVSKLVFATRNVAPWRDFVRSSVSSIKHRHGQTDILHITVKQSVRKEWMPWNPKVDSLATRGRKEYATITLWKLKIGLGHLQLPFVDVSDD